jgi:hypothetical protein
MKINTHTKIYIILLIVITVALAFTYPFIYSWRSKYSHYLQLSNELNQIHRARNNMGGIGGLSIVTVYGNHRPHNNIALNFRATEQNDQSITNLQGLTGIIGLDLSENTISDQCLYAIKDYERLEYLQISKTTIDDKGTEIINNLDNLIALDISWTKISQDSATFLEHMPKLKIIFSKGTDLKEVNGVLVINDIESESWINKWDGTIESILPEGHKRQLENYIDRTQNEDHIKERNKGVGSG